MNVLIACEESQRVCLAFRKRGHQSFSCDIVDCSGDHPEWHIKQDVLPLLNGDCEFETMDGTYHRVNCKWDLIIAHPPCTYLSRAGASRLYPKGELNNDRFKKGIAAKDFFMAFYNADCDKICIENPVPFKIFELPKYNQIIQPYEYGHPFSKATCLWLKGLDNMHPTCILSKEKIQVAKKAAWFNKGGKYRQRNRSKTFENIAEAMAEQWG